jgi:hypothetical protein
MSEQTPEPPLFLRGLILLIVLCVYLSYAFRSRKVDDIEYTPVEEALNSTDNPLFKKFRTNYLIVYALVVCESMLPSMTCINASCKCRTGCRGPTSTSCINRTDSQSAILHSCLWLDSYPRPYLAHMWDLSLINSTFLFCQPGINCRFPPFIHYISILTVGESSCRLASVSFMLFRASPSCRQASRS